MHPVTGVSNRGHGGFKSRRGALVAIVGILFIGLVAISAMTIDMARLGNLKADLQVAADAGAHAGAVQCILTPLNSSQILDSARAYVQRNVATWFAAPTIVAEMGVWNPISSTFTTGLPNPNAVHVALSAVPQGLIMEVVGVGPPVVHASAIGSTATFACLPAARPALVR